MAWLERKNDLFRIRFRYGKKKQIMTLRTSNAREAQEALSQFETNLRLIERGLLQPPPENADVGIFVLSGGKLSGRPSEQKRNQTVTK